MKSNTNLIGMAILFLAMAVSSSIVLWADIPTSAKIAMFAFGFAVGIPTGTLISRRSQR
ncbi:MAG TPA: hypothetical protein PK414_02815 [Anaerolineales bacterium]|nr:hypothetical protein [Anaerolineales bacterium]HNB35123.1 hypothetical protein [Anaerolineales bacterium]